MRYPNAEWVPWLYNGGDGPTYFKGMNKPIAAVLHIAQGYASTARQWAITGHYGASWHYTVCKDGTVLQHLDHEDGGYHAGIAVPPAPAPTWSLWKGSGINVNWYTIGIEHEGFSGDGFTPLQREASAALCRWLSSELGFPYDREHFPPHADIDLINRANDFGPPAYREEHYQFMFEEDEMTDRDILAIFGSTETTPEERLANAKYRYEQSILTGNSPFNAAANGLSKIDDHVANHAAGVGGVPPHKHVPGGVQ